MSISGEGADVRAWLVEPMSPAAAKLVDRLARAPDVRRVAVMPDVHPGHDVCVGAVVGTSGLIYPQAVGSDIGCGMSTLRFPGGPMDERVRVHVFRRMQRKLRVLTREPAFELPVGGLSDAGLEKAAARDGVRELGTLGRGNHFVEVQVDDDGGVWVLVHSGSRVMGQVITEHHVRRGVVRGPLAALEAGTAAGDAYLHDAAWAVEYARLNRRALLGDMARVMGEFGYAPEEASWVSTCHNLVRAEVHEGQALLVHRKGAATAASGELGVIPGSAATFTAHVEGRGCGAAMGSSSHGAGRVRSRSEARREVSARRMEREMGGVLFDRRLAPRLTDEAPSVYRNLRKVLAAQRELVKLVRVVRPVISFKGV